MLLKCSRRLFLSSFLAEPSSVSVFWLWDGAVTPSRSNTYKQMHSSDSESLFCWTEIFEGLFLKLTAPVNLFSAGSVRWLQYSSGAWSKETVCRTAAFNLKPLNPANFGGKISLSLSEELIAAQEKRAQSLCAVPGASVAQFNQPKNNVT